MNVEQLVASIMPIIMDKGFGREEKRKYIVEAIRKVAKHAREAGIRHTHESEEEYLKSIGL